MKRQKSDAFVFSSNPDDWNGKNSDAKREEEAKKSRERHKATKEQRKKTLARMGHSQIINALRAI